MIPVKPFYFYKDTAFNFILSSLIQLVLKPNLLELHLIERQHCTLSEVLSQIYGKSWSTDLFFKLFITEVLKYAQNRE